MAGWMSIWSGAVAGGHTTSTLIWLFYLHTTCCLPRLPRRLNLNDVAAAVRAAFLCGPCRGLFTVICCRVVSIMFRFGVQPFFEPPPPVALLFCCWSKAVCLHGVDFFPAPRPPCLPICSTPPPPPRFRRPLPRPFCYVLIERSLCICKTSTSTSRPWGGWRRQPMSSSSRPGIGSASTASRRGRPRSESVEIDFPGIFNVLARFHPASCRCFQDALLIQAHAPLLHALDAMYSAHMFGRVHEYL